ncbi:putative RING zinc finger protein [Hibiscus syriacus]|uniref:RING-type E3 ubiquitin transferase n=1 Tax=Hibiscus syriacus TaxID=106335 RepID=A0A6A2ZIQ6_HIBSY|nr:RING-H2 finger protein ATL78-like [Hibiscus syriacus]KAE8691219.1 putative RING zinc finger protein [Hibiscus syriacus]
MSTSSTPTQFSQHLLESFHPRKFLQHSSLYSSESPAQANSKVDENVIFVLSVLMFSVFTSLGLFFMVKCAVRCWSSVTSIANASAKSVTGGVEKNVLKAFPTVKYTSELKLPGLDMACVICLSEFVAGERVRILPMCNHGFHIRCIDKWLSSHSSCPTCRRCLAATDQEIAVNCSRTESSVQSGPVQESV